MIEGAHISVCGHYRYSLSRVWDDKLPTVQFVLLNPSTADAVHDDPTVRRCVGFAKRWGCGQMAIKNIFSLRATHPADLKGCGDLHGDRFFLIENVWRLMAQCPPVQEAIGFVVLGWGTHGDLAGRGEQVLNYARSVPDHIPIYTFGFTKNGNPRHPLFLPYDTPLVRLT
jgi:hypothetical protein